MVQIILAIDTIDRLRFKMLWILLYKFVSRYVRLPNYTTSKGSFNNFRFNIKGSLCVRFAHNG